MEIEELVTQPFARAVRRLPRSDDPTTIFDPPARAVAGSQVMRTFGRAPTAEELDQSYEAAMALF